MNNDSGVNTLLLVAVIVMLVIGGFWLYNRQAAAPADDSATINVTLPGGDESAE